MSALKRLSRSVALLVLALPSLVSAQSCPRVIGPAYVEYEAPLRLQGDPLLGGLVGFAAVLWGVLLVLSKRPRSGSALCAAGLALGIFLTVCRIEFC